MTRRPPRPARTSDDDPLTLVAAAIDPKIEVWPIERLSHYQARWVWPPSFRNGVEWQAFVADIRAAGIREPLIVLPDGQVVDGGHRLDAAREIELETAPVRVLQLNIPLTDCDRFALENWAVLDTLARRQLSRHEARGLVIDIEHAVAELQRNGATLPGYRRGRIETLTGMLGMSAAHTKQVLSIAHRGSQELRNRVKAGTLAVDTAYRILTGKIGEASPRGESVPAWPVEIDRLTAEATAVLSLTSDLALPNAVRQRNRRETASALETAANEIAELRLTVQGWLDSAA